MRRHLGRSNGCPFDPGRGHRRADLDATRLIARARAASDAPSLEGQIVFEDSGQDFQHSQIWLENADGSNVRQVVSDDFTDNSASLSPDGTKIVFYRAFTDSVEAAVADPSLFGALTVVNIDGSDLHEVDTADRAKRCDVAPGGRRVVPGRHPHRLRALLLRQAGPAVEAGVWTIKADGTDAQQVTRTLPDVQRPGPPRRLVAGRQVPDVRADRHLDDAGAGRPVHDRGRRQGPVPGHAVVGRRQRPGLVPDGSLIVFNASAEPSPTQNIWTIHPDGTGLTQLTTYDQDGQATFHPTWSPDGTQILFSHSPSTDGWGDFFVMNRDGTDQHVIAKTAMHENHGQWGAAAAP